MAGCSRVGAKKQNDQMCLVFMFDVCVCVCCVDVWFGELKGSQTHQLLTSSPRALGHCPK